MGTDNFGGLCKVYKAEEGAPDNICMTSEDLRIFLPLTREQLGQDGQDAGVAMPTLASTKGGN